MEKLNKLKKLCNIILKYGERNFHGKIIMKFKAGIPQFITKAYKDENGIDIEENVQI
jgi:hypothetical protein